MIDKRTMRKRLREAVSALNLEFPVHIWMDWDKPATISFAGPFGAAKDYDAVIAVVRSEIGLECSVAYHNRVQHPTIVRIEVTQ